MPELHDPSRNYDEDLLIGRVATGGSSGGFFSRRWGRWEWSNKKIIAAVLTLGILVATIVASLVVASAESKAVVIPTTVAPPASTSTVPTPSPAPPTTTKPPTTTTTATTTKPSTTTTTATTTTATTTTTTTTRTTPSPPITTNPPPTFPTTRRPLPPDAVTKPPISLLYEMEMRPIFIPILCNVTDLSHRTFKYIVNIEENFNYTGVDAGKNEKAKTAAALAANEAIFHLTYPPDSPYRPPKPEHPCF